MECRADAVFVLKHRRGAAVYAIAVEVQRRPDRRKAWSWPSYMTGGRARHHCPTCVLVIATNKRTATWARQELSLDGVQGWAPFVIELRDLPPVTSAKEARENPELAVLSALGRAREPAESAVLAATLEGLVGAKVETGEKLYYIQMLRAAASKAVRHALETTMQQGMDAFIRDFKRNYYDRGLEKGEKRGEKKGELKGKKLGALEASRALLLAIVEDRGLALSAAQRTRVDACTTPLLLQTWARRAALVRKPSEIFAEPKKGARR